MMVSLMIMMLIVVTMRRRSMIIIINEDVPEGVNNVCGNFEQGDANYKMQCLRLNKIGKFVQCRGSDSLPVMLVQFSWSQN